MKKNIFLTTIIAAISLVSCQKDIDIFTPNPVQPQGPDTAWYNSLTGSLPVNLLKEKLKLDVKLDSFELNANPATITTPAAQYSFPGNCCNGLNGQVVTGKVYLETMLITRKGDMIRMDKPTISNGRMLVSGGEIFVRLRKGNDELSLAPGKRVSITYSDPAPSPLMKLFYGDESNPDRFNWIPAMDSVAGQIGVFSGNQFYQLYSPQLRWINCDYFYDTTGASLVKLAANLPPQFTNGNSVAYLVFNNLRAVLPMYGNAAQRKFISNSVTAGLPVTIIVISKQGDDYYLGRESAVTNSAAATGGVQSVGITPVKKTIDEIKQVLSAL